MKIKFSKEISSVTRIRIAITDNCLNKKYVIMNNNLFIAMNIIRLNLIFRISHIFNLKKSVNIQIKFLVETA